MEILKTNIRKNIKEEENNAKVVVDKDMIVSDIYPDIKNILESNIEIYNLNTNLDDDKLIISGKLSLNVIYLSDDIDNQIASINELIDFSEQIIISKDASLDDIWLTSEISYLKVQSINSRKINTRIVLDVKAFVNNKETIEIITDLDDDDIEKKNKIVNIEEVTSIIKGECFIRDKFNIPSNKPELGALLKSSLEINNLELSFKQDEVLLKGSVVASFMYLSNDDGEIIFDKFNIPIKEEINGDVINELDVNILEKSNYEIKSMILGKNIYISEDENDEAKEINIDFKLDYSVILRLTSERKILEDAFIVNKKLDFDVDEVKYKSLVSKNINNVNLKDIIKLNINNIIQIADVKTKINIINTEEKIDSIELKGIAEVTLCALCLDDYNPLVIIKEEIPFTQIMQCKNIKKDNIIKVDTYDLNTSVNMLTSNEIEARINFTIALNVYDEKELKVITNAFLNEINDNDILVDLNNSNKSKIKVYIADKDEKLYDVAKKFNTKLSSITLISNNENIKDISAYTDIKNLDKVVMF